MTLLLAFRVVGSVLAVLAVTYFGFALKAANEISNDRQLAKSTRRRLEGTILASCVTGMLVVVCLGWALLAKSQTSRWQAGVAGVVVFVGFLVSSTTVFVLMTCHSEQISLRHWSLKVVHWVSLACAAVSTGSLALLGCLLNNWQPSGLSANPTSRPSRPRRAKPTRPGRLD